MAVVPGVLVKKAGSLDKLGLTNLSILLSEILDNSWIAMAKKSIDFAPYSPWKFPALIKVPPLYYSPSFSVKIIGLSVIAFNSFYKNKYYYILKIFFYTYAKYI